MSLWRWIRRHRDRSSSGANRETRRALIRMSRPQRHAFDRLIHKLEREPPEIVEMLLPTLPRWQRDMIEGRLNRRER